MNNLKSEVMFPKKDRKIMGNDNPNYDLILNYSTALTVAETDLKEANATVLRMKQTKKLSDEEKKLKKVIAAEFKELIADPSDSYEEGHNGGIEQCISLLNKLDFVKLLSKK